MKTQTMGWELRLVNEGKGKSQANAKLLEIYGKKHLRKQIRHKI